MDTLEITSIVSKVEVGAGVTGKQTHLRDQEPGGAGGRFIDSEHPGTMQQELPSFFHKKRLYFSILADCSAFAGPDSLGNLVFFAIRWLKIVG